MFIFFEHYQIPPHINYTYEETKKKVEKTYGGSYEDYRKRC